MSTVKYRESYYVLGMYGGLRNDFNLVSCLFFFFRKILSILDSCRSSQGGGGEGAYPQHPSP